MSTWRRIAIDLFPVIKQDIEESGGPGEAWSYIEYRLLDALNNGDTQYIKHVKQYFSWCISTKYEDTPHQAVLCGFLEDIGRNKHYWPHLSKLLTKQQFEYYKPSLGYARPAEFIKEMEATFYDR